MSVASSQSFPAHRRDPMQAETTAKAALRQGVWEASQFMDYDEIRRYVEAVLREIESDKP